MTNAEYVIKAFGGATRMSKMTGIPRSTITMWKMPKPTGSGGKIPHKHKLTIAKLALDHGLNLTKYILDEE